MTKPSEILAGIVDSCPETHEPQGILHVLGKEAGSPGVTIITRGETTAWRHTITTVEVDPQANIKELKLTEIWKARYERLAESADVEIKRLEQSEEHWRDLAAARGRGNENPNPAIIHKLTHGEPEGWPDGELMQQAWDRQDEEKRATLLKRFSPFINEPTEGRYQAEMQEDASGDYVAATDAEGLIGTWRELTLGHETRITELQEERDKAAETVAQLDPALRRCAVLIGDMLSVYRQDESIITGERQEMWAAEQKAIFGTTPATDKQG